MKRKEYLRSKKDLNVIKRLAKRDLNNFKSEHDAQGGRSSKTVIEVMEDTIKYITKSYKAKEIKKQQIYFKLAEENIEMFHRAIKEVVNN